MLKCYNVLRFLLQEGEVYILPTIRINAGQYRGKLSYTEVLRALCAGFNKNDEPAACNKVGEADCRVGAPGDVDCKNRWALQILLSVWLAVTWHCSKAVCVNSVQASQVMSTETPVQFA